MDLMDFEVLPGPSLPELARTALARAAAATVSDANPIVIPPAAGPVPVRSGRDGSPLLLPASGSPVARWLGAGPSAERVSVPAGAPFSALRLFIGGMAKADWVIPRNLDRYGLELLVLTADGAAPVRLSFPDGPITSIDDVPASIRTALTCRCQSGSEYRT
jgi:hypothetical protein